MTSVPRRASHGSSHTSYSSAAGVQTVAQGTPDDPTHPVPPVQHRERRTAALRLAGARSGGAARACRLPVLSAQPQRSPVEGDRLLDMAVPVVPCVCPGELGVFVRDAELSRWRWKARFPLGAHPPGRSRDGGRGGACGPSLRPAHTDRRGLRPARGQDAVHLLRDLGALDPPPDIERRGVGDGAAEELRAFERQLDRAVASHRQSPDHPPLPLRNRVERAIHEADHLFEEVTLVGRTCDRVAVKPRPPSGITTIRGFVASCAQKLMKGQLPWSVEGITRPGNRTVQPQ